MYVNLKVNHMTIITCIDTKSLVISKEGFESYNDVGYCIANKNNGTFQKNSRRASI